MTVPIDALMRPRDLDDAGDVSGALSTTYLLTDKSGWNLPRRLSLADLFGGNVLTVSETSGAAGLLAAQTAASSGDTIRVLAGTYTLTSALSGKNGVNWYFDPGAVVNATDCFCFDVSTGITFSVYGYGDFVGNFSSGQCGGLKVNHASAVVTFFCKRLRTVGGQASADAALYVHDATRVYVEAEEISASSTSYYTVYWASGDLFINAKRIFNEGGTTSTSTITGVTSGAGYKMWINADEVYHANSTAFGAVQTGAGSSATSAVWMNVKELRCSASSLYSCIAVAGGKFYLNAQKIFNQHASGVAIKVSGASTLCYITTQKIEASAAISNSSGTSWISCDEFNDSGQSGTTITCSGGVNYISGKSILRTGSGVGVSHSGGTTRLSGLFISPLDGATNYPLSISGSGFKGQNLWLIAPATPSYTINAGSAQTVQLVGCAGNKTTNNITVQGVALAVDSSLS